MKEVCSVLGALFGSCRDSAPHAEGDNDTTDTVASIVNDDASANLNDGLPPGVSVIYMHGDNA